MGTLTTELPGAQGGQNAFGADPLEEMTTVIAERLPYFQRMALRRLDNMADAEDAVQDALLSAWKHLDKFKGQAKMSTWLTVIVLNSARMVARKRPRTFHFSLEAEDQSEEQLCFTDMLPDTRPDPEAQVRRRELEQRINQLSVHLAPHLREVIRLRGVEGLSIRETAGALGLTESAVKTRAARAREELRRLDQCNPAKITGASESGPARRRRRPMPAPMSRV
jgi:RNA polymerase sigma-70 factor (ECF subfamily)